MLLQQSLLKPMVGHQSAQYFTELLKLPPFLLPSSSLPLSIVNLSSFLHPKSSLPLSFPQPNCVPQLAKVPQKVISYIPPLFLMPFFLPSSSLPCHSFPPFLLLPVNPQKIFSCLKVSREEVFIESICVYFLSNYNVPP